MPLNSNASIEVTALRWVPPGAQGLVKDLRVRWALEEAGLDYRVRLVGGERPPEYVKDQPFNQVPCLRDETVQIFESGAILQYIGEKSEALLPRDPGGKYRAIQWTYAAVSSIEPFVQLRALLNVVLADQAWAEPAKPTFDHFARLRLRQLSDRLGDRALARGRPFHHRRPDDGHGLENRRSQRPARRLPRARRLREARAGTPGLCQSA